MRNHTIDPDGEVLWRAKRRIRNMNTNRLDEIGMITDNDGNHLTNNKDKANAFNAKFCLYSHLHQTLHSICDLDLNHIPAMDESIYPHDNAAAHTINNPNLRFDYVHAQALNKLNKNNIPYYLDSAVSRLKCNVNPGGGIHPKLFKLIYRPLKPALKKHRHDINSYREINMGTTSRKILDDIHCNKLIEYIIRTQGIHNNNIGALRHKSVHDAVAVLCTDVLRQWIDHGNPVCGIVTDIKGCYPGVRYRTLLRRLEVYYGIDRGRFFESFKGLLLNSWTATMVNGVLSDWYIMRGGLAQGRVSSPFMNLLYLEPIHHCLNQQDYELYGFCLWTFIISELEMKDRFSLWIILRLIISKLSTSSTIKLFHKTRTSLVRFDRIHLKHLCLTAIEKSTFPAQTALYLSGEFSAELSELIPLFTSIA
eukprot:975845_1